MLSRFTIGIKIGAIVVIMAGSAFAISTIAYQGLTALAESADRINAGAEEVRLAAAMNQNAVEMSRAEYRIIADPSSFQDSRSVALESRTTFNNR